MGFQSPSSEGFDTAGVEGEWAAGCPASSVARAQVPSYPSGWWGPGLAACLCCPLTSLAFRERLSVARAAYLGHRL